MVDIPGYKVLGTIRATGSNVLFQAVREADGLPVILKTPIAPTPGPNERERYRREFGILQRLQAVRGVAKPYACERIRERPVLLLEKVQGEPLSESVGQPFGVSQCLGVAISLASTLAEIHCHNVIHKDIKPSNIILEPSGQARLIDFGVATLHKVEHLEAVPAHQIEGTLAYMSPEQTGRMNRAVDYRTDFYSLGVTLYELLTGQRPFQGRDALEWFHAHMAQHPRPPHELNPEVPLALSAIVMKLLAKVAEERYQSAEGLSADLERCREALGQNALEGFIPGTQDTSHQFQLPQRLYGREAQVATLLQGFERVARTGRPELFLVSGYSGIGKSSVVQELYKPVVQRRGFFLRGKFDQFQRDIPYATLAQAIRGLVQQLLAGSDEELARWRERVLQAWEGDGQVLVDLVPQLEVLVGAQPPLQVLPPNETKHRLHRVVWKFLQVFATTAHPLVMFLDDLQWADLASLKLIQQLLTQPEMPPVLWIGAYRDNEVSAAHPLMPVLEETRQAGVPVTGIRLEPLNLEQVEQLVADMLPGVSADVAGPLAALAHEKTGGNPFFLLQWMVTLNQDGLLVRIPGGWGWDAQGVRTRGYSDNVVHFMVDKLRQFPAGTQHLLRLAACVGNVFSVPVLGTLVGLGERGEVEQGLEPALQEGMLARVGLEQYRFLHDRIQQAAHALFSETERKAVHLRVGRLLLENLSQAEVGETLFDVLSQLNAGAELIDEPAERHQVARLNAEAGKKAASAVAHRPAIAYFKAAFALIPGDGWETDYELAFRVRLARAKCELQSSNIAEARSLVEELLSRARTPADSTAAYCLKRSICLAVGEIQGAITCMLECLARLGMPLSPHPTREEVVTAHEEMEALIGQRSIESFIDLPLMTDPDMKVAMSALSALYGPAYITDNHLLIIVLCRMVSFTLRHGFTDEAVPGFSWLGAVSGSFFKRYREGHALCLLARAFVERYDLTSYRALMLLCLHLSSNWNQPLSVSQELLQSCFQHGLQSGDFVVASYSCVSLMEVSLAMGQNLDEVYQGAVRCNGFVSQAGLLDAQDSFLSTLRYVQQLRGRSLSFTTMSGEGFDEQSFEAKLTPARMSTMRCEYWILKLQSRFMCGAYAEALEAAETSAGLLWSMKGSIAWREHHFYRALTLAACFGRATPEEQRRFLEDIELHRQQLAEWSANCPENFLALERMVTGELARLEGRSEEAIRSYEEAIRLARQSGAVHHVGLASELSANFWRARQSPIAADAFAREARAAYKHWGALGKVQHLDAQWPHLIAIPAADGTDTSSTDAAWVDALTVVKAQQAISGEIVLERLVTTLLRAAIENAGAQRGTLLLPDGDTLTVAATSSGVPGSAIVPAGEEVPELPWTLLAYVRRTREPVLIGDASRSHPFSSDAYLERSGTRSVLCLPLMRQEHFSGVLYLENNLATNAFSPARLTLLGYIASQAAISIDNARLYADVQRAKGELRQANDELERRVEERTHELKQAQARLVDTAREVGMSEVASNVLHNVGNVLTSAVINLETMHKAVGASRVSRLKQATALLLKHRESLTSFLALGARGGHLPEYLAALADELVREQTQLLGDLDAMGQHVEHIRAIVQVQQIYARTSLLTEECDLGQLIDDALRIQMVALQRHGVSVHRELSPVPRVKVDKHKVLQILINLFSNAKNALSTVPEGLRRMSVRLRVEGKRVRIQVEDNGMGIAPETRPNLFTHGFTTREDGHGFGLHSSALAAQMLGGHLMLESEGLGKGAVATLELPLT
ncbi:trifunctional serine/threonine-protein kinase/ATP-binding protein/sensor histidine kinase [Stigmatella aurantiaca]|uniref:histidine kinase n=1 Tax=Stigmatella aurantiaca (strain DW4/3-1) TaxID=378806 RepID=Q08PB2_STIAD|nr:AAA family ATPase [Stigmatella aurantiaca]ADO72871.1 Serine/threonine protein kinase [Stigmatella aurantiaca DW4/3-1]EAU62320.1 serine/threonine protein kinase and signal transduction histidine kinase (sthk) with gaf and pas/pac sensor [Stigmatella aurantiaca DW4/3-1]